MSTTEEEYEEVSPEDLKVNEYPDEAPNDVKEEDEQEEQEEKQHKPDNFSIINQKRNQNKNINIIRFIKEFTKNPDARYDEVAASIGITKEAAKKYLKEYTDAVINSIKEGTFPAGVMLAFNSASIPSQHRLHAGDVQYMKPILLKYNKTNVDSLLGEEEEEEDEEERPINEIDQDVDDFMEEDDKGQFYKYNKFKREKSEINTNPRVIAPNSPIVDVIEFGLINSGQAEHSKIRRVKTLFMSSPNHYLLDESAFTTLLESNGIAPKPLATFMDWLKHVAPIKPDERIGFLALSYQPQIATQGGGPQMGMGGRNSFDTFDISQYSDFIQFLYHEGVYEFGYPPEHYINKQAYKKYLEDKREEEEEKRSIRKNALTFKKNMGMFGGPMGMGMPNGMGMNQQGGPSYAFDERAMVEKGLLQPEITYDAMGNKTTRLLPTGRQFNPDGTLGVSGGYGLQPTTSKIDEFEKMVMMWSKMAETMKNMYGMQNGNGQQGTGNPVLDKIVGAFVDSNLNKQEKSPEEVLQSQMNLFNTFKQIYPDAIGGQAKQLSPLDIEAKKVDAEIHFRDKEIDIKREMADIERNRLERQESESKNGLETIFGMIEKGVNMFMPTIQALMQGQIGGGLNQMIPPQGPTMEIPPQQSQETEFVDNGGFNQMQPPPQQQENNDGLPPGYIPPQQYVPPQDFMPSQPPPQQITQPVSENEFINNVTNDDLETLNTTQLTDVSERIESKLNKLAKLLNEIKSTKAKKQFGYSHKKVADKYHVLDVPSDMNPNYDGLNEDERYIQEEPPTVEPQQQIDINEEVAMIDNQQGTDLNDIANLNKDFAGEPVEET